MKTLRYLSLTATLACMGLAAQAQTFHFSGGYNGSNVDEAASDVFTGRAGYQFGVDLLLGNRWFVKPGVHFLVRNLDYSIATTDDQGNPVTSADEFRYTSRALRVPVHLGFRLIDPESDPLLNIYAFGGPSALMNLKADLDQDELDVQTNSTQWYVGAGAGLELGFLFIEGGYDVAMTNVFKGDDFNTNPKVNFLYASAGLRLRLAD